MSDRGAGPPPPDVVVPKVPRDDAQSLEREVASIEEKVPPSVDAASDMSLEEMLALAVTKHQSEVSAHQSELAVLQERVSSLTRQLQAYRKRARTNTESVRSAAEQAAALPNTIPTASESTRSGANGSNVPEDLSPAKSCLSDPEELEVLSPTASPMPELKANAWMPISQPRQPRDFTRKASASESLRSSNRSATHTEFRMKQTWEPSELEPYCEVSTSIGRSRSRAFERFGREYAVREDENAQLERGEMSGGPWFIGLPTSPKRLAWDFVGAVLIFYDLFKLPMDAFSPPESTVSRVMDWLILVFWTANVGASLSVGHLEHGEMVLSPSKIALRYFKTWFAVDLLVVVPDWVFTILAFSAPADGSKDAGSEDSVKLLRVLRLIRMMRLLRLLKLRKIFETINDMISSEYVSVIANIVKMIMMLLVINHLISCVWFLLAESQKHQSSTWTTFHGFDDVHWIYQYTTAFHWSITQFTPASMHVQPQNTLERTFTIVVVVFALVGFSYMVGSITGSLAQLRSMHAEESKLFWDLRRYLTKSKVNTKLSLRIQKYLEHAWHTQQERKPVKDVKLMQLLSEQLQAELRYALAVNQLKIHPFLDQLSMYSSITVHRLANCAISHKLLAAGDSLFHRGEAATHMYIVVEGSYVYRRRNALGDPCDEQVDKGEDWIAEPVLWLKSWIHLGVLIAIKEGDNLTIETKSFGEQVSLNPQAHLFASGYAQNFVTWLNGFEPDNLSDISQGEDVGELFRSFIPTDVFDMYDAPDAPKADHGGGALDRMKSFKRSATAKLSRSGTVSLHHC